MKCRTKNHLNDTRFKNAYPVQLGEAQVGKDDVLEGHAIVLC